MSVDEDVGMKKCELYVIFLIFSYKSDAKMQCESCKVCEILNPFGIS